MRQKVGQTKTTAALGQSKPSSVVSSPEYQAVGFDQDRNRYGYSISRGEF